MFAVAGKSQHPVAMMGDLTAEGCVSSRQAFVSRLKVCLGEFQDFVVYLNTRFRLPKAWLCCFTGLVTISSNPSAVTRGLSGFKKVWFQSLKAFL